MRTLIILMQLVFLVACSHVETTSTPFHGENHLERGMIAILPIDKTQESSLQFNAVKNYFAKKLIENGYSVANQSGKVDFVAFITYGIDDGKVVNSAMPIYGQTGGGTSYSSGNVVGSSGRSASFNSTTTTMPTYGMVGSVPVSSRTYKRDLNIDIYKVSTGVSTKVYEIRAFSSGSCGNINAVIFNIIDGVFENFPGQSGKPKRVNVKWEGDC